MQYSQSWIILPFVLAGCFSCGNLPDKPGFTNPLDPENPEFVLPETTIHAGPVDGAVLDTHAVSIAWGGNEQVAEFSYRISGSDWSEWVPDTSIALQYLNEGLYLFEVKGRYLSGLEDESPAEVNFEVDDIHGPALRLFPRYISTAPGDSFTVEIFLEEVDDVKGVKAVLKINPGDFTVGRINIYQSSTSLLKQNGGTVVGFSSFEDSSGILMIEAATATGNPAGVSGSGAIAEVSFTARMTGQFDLVFTSASELRDPDNGDIPLFEMVNAVVEVQ